MKRRLRSLEKLRFFIRAQDYKKKETRQVAWSLDFLERETRFELATSTLARLHSTTELFPLSGARRDERTYV